MRAQESWTYQLLKGATDVSYHRYWEWSEPPESTQSPNLTSLNVPLGEEPKPNSTIDNKKKHLPEVKEILMQLKLYTKRTLEKSYKCNLFAKS